MRNEVYERLDREAYLRKREEKGKQEQMTLLESAERRHLSEEYAE